LRNLLTYDYLQLHLFFTIYSPMVHGADFVFTVNLSVTGQLALGDSGYVSPLEN